MSQKGKSLTPSVKREFLLRWILRLANEDPLGPPTNHEAGRSTPDRSQSLRVRTSNCPRIEIATDRERINPCTSQMNRCSLSINNR
jgi:hypothetical protein